MGALGGESVGLSGGSPDAPAGNGLPFPDFRGLEYTLRDDHYHLFVYADLGSTKIKTLVAPVGE